MPFCQITLRASRPLSAAYPRRLETLGDHLRKRRLDLKLLQSQVAQQIGACETSIHCWETNQKAPDLEFIPKIIGFLGYVPELAPATATLGQRIVASRRILGVTQKQLARRLGIDPSTLGRWEKDLSWPRAVLLSKLETALGRPVG